MQEHFCCGSTLILLRFPAASSYLSKYCKMTLTRAKRRDPNTFANYDEFITKHTVANFSINFEQEKLVGNVVLTLKPVTNSKGKEIILDTSYLDIKQIRICGLDAEWDLLDRLEPYGSALKIKLESEIRENESVEIVVRPIAELVFKWDSTKGSINHED